MSEIRSLVGLKHHGVGVEASHKDQETEDLLQVLKDWCQLYPGMSFLVTGPKDLIVSGEPGCNIGEMAVQNWTG